MDYLDLTNYFSAIAQKNKEIAHSPVEKRFFEGIPDEVIKETTGKLGITDTILILEPYILHTNDEEADNHENIWEVDFNVLQYYNSSQQNWQDLQAIWNKTLHIALQIRSRIHLDRLYHNPFSNDVIRHFKPGSAVFTKVDLPIGNDFYGTRCELQFHSKGQDYNPTSWLDGNPYIL